MALRLCHQPDLFQAKEVVKERGLVDAQGEGQGLPC